MNRIFASMVALAFSCVPLPVIAANHPNRQLHGSDIARACTAERGFAFCNGFIDAIELETGQRYLDRTCPPPIVMRNPNELGFSAGAVLTYISRHPEVATQDARDVVFFAITDRLSMDMECHDTRARKR